MLFATLFVEHKCLSSLLSVGSGFRKHGPITYQSAARLLLCNPSMVVLPLHGLLLLLHHIGRVYRVVRKSFCRKWHGGLQELQGPLGLHYQKTFKAT